MEAFSSIITSLENWIWGAPMLILLCGTHIFMTLRTGFIQKKTFTGIRLSVTKDPDSPGDVSQFQALATALASTIGTGNIIGVSTAICLGGPGAIFWMWVTALLGGATAFIESTLAQIYKKRAPDGSCYGGPAYFMRDALGKRWLCIIFSVLIILIYAVGYNMLAAYNLQSTFSVFKFYHPVITPAFIGVILAFLFGVMVLGGAKRLASITEILVPFMGILYVLVSLLIIFLNIRNVPGMFAAISFDEGKTWPVKRLLTDGKRRLLDGRGWTGYFEMDENHAEPRGYLAGTQTPDNVVHILSSRLHYRFNLAWLEK